MDNENMIEIHDLVKTYKMYAKPVDRMKEALSITKKKYYKPFNALDGISFSISKGETVGIVGTNGSGKSTLLKIITGVLQATSGEVAVNGRVSALLELGTGFNPEYTGMDNIYLNGSVMGYTREEVTKKIPEILEFAGIGDFIYQPVKTYSSGMFARLAFAVAINVDPEILIVDEALSVGDTRFQLKCMERMKEMMENDGTTVLFVSHDTNAIRRFCTRAIWLNRGNIVHMGAVNETVDKYLDFLKLGEDALLEDDTPSNTDEETDLKPFAPGDMIAEIIGFKFRNKKTGKITDQVSYDTPVEIEVIYDVYDENITDPVLGVAMHSIDNDYVCGLNTLLDKIKIPWKYGRNRFFIRYGQGLLSRGGKYTFDTALMDSTASVNFDYKACVQTITVSMDYIAEGRYVIPHKWHE